ncbi:hypothetical protein [Streptosporangium sp. CA-115845]|uniref:hypothetical protein n=1 Tax=Streptosporangium sp. CA-115845 TaxID=3240071 RepID=UPI003D9211D6
MDAHITSTPAKARTDVEAADTPPAEHRVTIVPQTIRRLGLVLAVCTLAWAVSNAAYGPNGEGLGSRMTVLAGLAFQLGLFALVTVQMRTLATGTSRVSMIMLKVEMVLLVPACLWSLLHGILPGEIRKALWMTVLDIFWPLSMVGMCVIGVKIAFADQWRGVLRWWPLIAESWAFVAIPSLMVLGEPVGRWIGAGYLLVGYGVLGLLLAWRPELTVARR